MASNLEAMASNLLGFAEFLPPPRIARGVSQFLATSSPLQLRSHERVRHIRKASGHFSGGILVVVGGEESPWERQGWMVWVWTPGCWFGYVEQGRESNSDLMKLLTPECVTGICQVPRRSPRKRKRRSKRMTVPKRLRTTFLPWTLQLPLSTGTREILFRQYFARVLLFEPTQALRWTKCVCALVSWILAHQIIESGPPLQTVSFSFHEKCELCERCRSRKTSLQSRTRWRRRRRRRFRGPNRSLSMDPYEPVSEMDVSFLGDYL